MPLTLFFLLFFLINSIPFLLYLLSKKYKNRFVVMSKWIVLFSLLLFWFYQFLDAMYIDYQQGEGGEFFIIFFAMASEWLLPQLVYFIYKGRKK